jgi:hypothetical protein
MKGSFLLLNSHLLAIYNLIPILFDNEQSLQLKHNSKNQSPVSVSLQCERLLILCLEAAYIHPPPPLIAAVQLHTFPQILVPFLLRRVKADVALNIPPKKELLVYAPMSPLQLELYRATVEHNYNKLLRNTEKVRQIRYSYCSCQLYNFYLLFL